MSDAVDITVSIVSMNNEDFLTRCLTSIFAYHRHQTLEVIVVFYRTQSETVARILSRFPSINVVISPDDEVRGYGENQNLGLRRARGTHCVILNDDVEFFDNALERMFAYSVQHQSVASLVPRLLNEDGTHQSGLRGKWTPASYTFRSLKLNSLLNHAPAIRRWLIDPRPSSGEQSTTANYGTGALFWIRRDWLVAIGYMDEKYFLAPDDIDLSCRLRAAGGQMVYLPDIAVTHTGSVTLSKVFSKVFAATVQGDRLLLRQQFGRLPAALTMLVRTIATPAFMAYWATQWAAGNRDRANIMLRAHANVLRFAFCPPASPKDAFLRAW